jgi:N-glycosylase/DNA lyase
MNRIDEDNKVKYSLIAYGRYLEMTQLSQNTVELSCSEEEFKKLWEEYFDLNYDYSKIVADLMAGDDQFLKEAVNFGKGIRILKQEPFEAAISFIISQNKNIPAIKNCIEGICRRYGENRIYKEKGIAYHTFPGADYLSIATKEELRLLKAGYRDEYILQAAKAVLDGTLNLEELKQMKFEEAVSTLKKVHGIGDKVANCIALYGLHHIEGFPIDVWILRAIKEIYNNKFNKDKYQGYAGIVQQYMFYYIRHLKRDC